MSAEMRRTLLTWIVITVAVMFILPFAVARLASECAGMALCMMLFLVINPIYSIILGIVGGRHIKSLWSLPLVCAVAFLAGVWSFFDIHEPWFIAYAVVYLCTGVAVMIMTNYLKSRYEKYIPRNGSDSTAI